MHVYRQLLRAVDRNITSVTGNPRWREFVAVEFRKHRGEADPARVRALLAAAKDYAFLIDGVREHKASGCGVRRPAVRQQGPVCTFMAGQTAE